MKTKKLRFYEKRGRFYVACFLALASHRIDLHAFSAEIKSELPSMWQLPET